MRRRAKRRSEEVTDTGRKNDALGRLTIKHRKEVHLFRSNAKYGKIWQKNGLLWVVSCWIDNVQYITVRVVIDYYFRFPSALLYTSHSVRDLQHFWIRFQKKWVTSYWKTTHPVPALHSPLLKALLFKCYYSGSRKNVLALFILFFG